MQKPQTEHVDFVKAQASMPHPSATPFMPDKLNPAQLEAVNTLEGPLLILAGAGSGKTRVLTFRTANLIHSGLARPDEILAVTFTNKAAREMLHRIQSILADLWPQGPQARRQLWVSTFHSICARILREHITALDYPSFFAIYDSSDQLSVIKKVCSALDLDEKLHPAKGFQALISQVKCLGLTPEKTRGKHGLMRDTAQKVYEQYELEMKKSGALDFDDLLLKTLELFQNFPEILHHYQMRFRYIMVDEYQDTNHIQYLIIKKLAECHDNLCVVGDEDQSIYSWRGADIRNILDFEKDFPNAHTIKLEENYRSTQTIVNAATELIQNNSQRKKKVLFTQNAAGSLIRIREEHDEYEEARSVVREIERMFTSRNTTTSEPLQLSDFAIFYRTNAQSRVLEEQLRGRNIAYKIIGGMKFYERMEIKDILAYMRLSLNPRDDVSFKRVINVPTRGIGKSTIDKISDFAAQRGETLREAATWAIDHRELHVSATRKVREFLQLLEKLEAEAKSYNVSDFYHQILDSTGYVQRLREENTPEADSRIQNLEELDNAILRFREERGEEGSLQQFLEEMALIQDTDLIDETQTAPSVTLMTLHISKGLEFPVVFIVGMEEGLFPSHRSIHEGDPTAIEEERRLCYVGMTRARQHLMLTYARSRRVWGNEQFFAPSRFLSEIPEEWTERTSAVRQISRWNTNKSLADKRYPHSPTRSTSPSYAPTQNKTNPYDPHFSEEYFSQESEHSENNFSAETFSSSSSSGSSSSGSNSSNASSSSNYRKGERVRHPTYGVGSIYEIEGTGPEMRLSILFQDNSLKKFVAKYARLSRV